MNPIDDQPTLPMRSADDRSLDAALDLTLERQTLDVHPASSNSVFVKIRSKSQRQMRLHISLSGTPADWIELDQTALMLDGGQSESVKLTVTPPRSPDMPPSDCPCVIRVADASGASIQRQLLIRLGGFSGLSLALSQSTLADGDSFTIFLRNQGNVELALGIKAREPSGQLAIHLPQDRLNIAPGQKMGLPCRVESRQRPLFGKPRTLPFALVLATEDASGWQVALPAGATVTPRLTPRLATILTFLICAIALGIFAFLSRPAPPTITAFKLESGSIRVGEPVLLTWAADNAERFIIEVDGVALADLPLESRQYTLASDDFAKPVSISLIAASSDERAVETLTLAVYPPVTIERFTVEPTEMRRHTLEDLRLTWRVQSAEKLDIRFPPLLETVSDIGDDAEGREIVLRGFIESDFEILLSAEDAAGALSQQRLTVRAIDAECAPNDSASIHAAPDPESEQLAIAVADVPLPVAGITPEGNWLRVEMATGTRGWGRLADFVCIGFDAAALKQVDALPAAEMHASTSTDTPEASG